MKRGSFGKRILVAELIAVVIISFGGFALAWGAIANGYSGSLPWITAMIAPSWAAYGVSKAAYNNKVMKESLPYCEAEAASINRDA